MIDFPYTYTVKRVDEDHKLIEVEYSAVGYEMVTVSMPLIRTNGDFEELVRQYAPAYDWVIKHIPYRQVEVGTSGTIEPFQPAVLPSELPELSEEDVLRMIEELKTENVNSQSAPQ